MSHRLLAKLAQIVSLAVIAVVVAAASPSARAHSYGMPNVDCNGCHGGGATPSAPAFTSVSGTCIDTGTTTEIRVTFSDANGGGGGWNLTIQSGPGSLSTGGAYSTDTTPDGVGGITHNARKDGSGGTVYWSAIYSASGGAGTVTFIAHGNAVNNDGWTTGDKANVNTFSITVASAPSCGGRNCGPSAGNACGHTVASCGTCTAPQTCGGSGTTGVCGCTSSGSPCAGKNCGTVLDSCSLPISCGSCSANQSCGGGGTANVCGCAPSDPIPTCGVGACQRSGTTCLVSSCSPGSPSAEVCDGIDNNCNGVVDDGLPLSTCGVGACARTGSTCMASSCTPGSPSAEVCNGVDDDCDGTLDDGAPDDMVHVVQGGLDFWIDKYEASKPDATARTAASSASIRQRIAAISSLPGRDDGAWAAGGLRP